VSGRTRRQSRRGQVEAASLDAVAVAGRGARHGAGQISAVPGPAVLDGDGFLRVNEVEAVVAVPPGATAAKHIARAAFVGPETVGALPGAVRGHRAVVVVRVAGQDQVVAAPL